MTVHLVRSPGLHHWMPWMTCPKYRQRSFHVGREEEICIHRWLPPALGCCSSRRVVGDSGLRCTSQYRDPLTVIPNLALQIPWETHLSFGRRKVPGKAVAIIMGTAGGSQCCCRLNGGHGRHRLPSAGVQAGSGGLDRSVGLLSSCQLRQLRLEPVPARRLAK